MKHRFTIKFASTEQLKDICSIYDSFLQFKAKSSYSFNRFKFSYWKGNEAIPPSRASNFDSSVPLLSKTFSSPSSVFFFLPSFRLIANSVDQSIRSSLLCSLSTFQTPSDLCHCLLASLGPDPDSQAALLWLVPSFPAIQSHFSSLLLQCSEFQAPVHAVVQLFEWWMFCELVWKEHSIRDYAIAEALNSPIAVRYQTLWKLNRLQMEDRNDVLRCLVSPQRMQETLLRSLTKGSEQDVQLVFSMLALNSEWDQTIYYQKYMENVLQSKENDWMVRSRFDGLRDRDL